MRSSSLDISVKFELVAGWMRLVGNSLGRAASNWTSQSTVRAPNTKPLEISVSFTGIRLICLCRYHNSFEIAQGEPTMQPATPRPERIQLQLQAWSSDWVGRPPPDHPRPPAQLVWFSARVPSLGGTSHDFYTRPTCLRNMRRIISEH